WFHATADPWREEAWGIIRQRPDLIFQIVTQRPERIEQCLPADWGDGYPNVWLIVTTENQQRLNERLPHLLRVPAVVRGLSCEPLLGPIEFREVEYAGPPIKWDRPKAAFGGLLHWVIDGGESG